MTKSPRHPARDGSSVASLVTLLLLSLSISSCESVCGFGATPVETRAERLVENGQHEEAAGIYIRLASATVGSEQNRLTLLAVEQYLDAGDDSRARNAFRNMQRPATTNERWLWSTNSAALSLYAGEADAALGVLEAMSRESLPRRRRLRVEALRADAWIQKSRDDQIIRGQRNMNSGMFYLSSIHGTAKRRC